MGYRLTHVGQSAYPLARISLSLVHARIAWNRGEPEQLEARRLCDSEEDGGTVQAGSRDRAARIALPLDLAAKRKRAVCHGNSIGRPRSCHYVRLPPLQPDALSLSAYLSSWVEAGCRIPDRCTRRQDLGRYTCRCEWCLLDAAWRRCGSARRLSGRSLHIGDSCALKALNVKGPRGIDCAICQRISVGLHLNRILLPLISSRKCEMISSVAPSLDRAPLARARPIRSLVLHRTTVYTATTRSTMYTCTLGVMASRKLHLSNRCVGFHIREGQYCFLPSSS